MSESISAPSAPWEAASPQDQLFVLITGANSGIGLATAQRLIDSFLATRSRASHLILIPTTRSAAKSAQTIRQLEAYTPADSRHRIHVISPTLDICDLGGVAAFARGLLHGGVASRDGVQRAVRVPRLDALVFNAAYGGWIGCDYLGAVWAVLTRGFLQAITWPTFKLALPTCVLNSLPEYSYPPQPLLGQVFTACVFGHYLLAHYLAPLLCRSSSSSLPPGRIIWSSSLEATVDVFSPDDMQCLDGPSAYESAKRLTDILALTCLLPAASPYSSRWLAGPDEEKCSDKDDAPLRPQVYLSHPGIVASTLFPVPWFLFWAYEWSLVVARWLGSPWHVGSAYAGAAAASWLVLEPHESLASVDDLYATKDKHDSSITTTSCTTTQSRPLAAQRIKWGSATSRTGRSAVKQTHVDGWGFDGHPPPPPSNLVAPSPRMDRILRPSVGRRRGAPDVTPDDIIRFEELGAQCWRAMEDLRAQWSDLLDLDDGRRVL
ncbi:hypothetical protein CDD81_5343 [Ophiocordyceps australis]|uniref:3-ketosteroid reductase n=1 Tax=Ophiocordyceps australis TaxID=1399860 RepID=A0A2C5Y342_9HYPO|nr:hypothetical protein CDD81_5343 [Ophiocordyceps australis]